MLLEISQEIEARLAEGGESERAAFAARVKCLMDGRARPAELQPLPRRLSARTRAASRSKATCARAFFAAYEEDDCEYLPLMSPEIDERLKNGPELVSANFVIPYPPGFPIMVPGQVIDADTIGFMRKLDVKEIHGYNATRGLKLIKLSAIGKTPAGAHGTPVRAAPPKGKPTAKKGS